MKLRARDLTEGISLGVAWLELRKMNESPESPGDIASCSMCAISSKLQNVGTHHRLAWYAQIDHAYIGPG